MKNIGRLDKEESITARFHEVLIEEYEQQGLPWHIGLESPVTDLKTGKELRRNDLRFFHYAITQRVFFSIEAKRLNIPYPSGFDNNADGYIDEGMLRFVIGAYSQNLESGAMIGYVMDGNCQTAQINVNNKIRKEVVKLKTQNTEIQSALPEIPIHLGGKTIHMRDANHGGSFWIYHLFLAVS